MAKRLNVNGQQRRDDYEADEMKQTEEKSGSFQMASADKLSKRRIISTSRSRKWSALAKNKAPTPSPPVAPPAASPTVKNPFANIGKISPPAPSSSISQPQKDHTAKSSSNDGNNPFANISFASSAPAPIIGVVDTAAVKEKLLSLHFSFFQWVMEETLIDPVNNLSSGMANYIQQVKNLTAEAPKAAPANGSGASASASAKAEVPSSFNSAPAASTGFSFGKSAALPKPGDTGAPSTGFSFGKAASTAPAVTAPPPVKTTPPISTTGGDTDDTPKDKVEAVLKETNTTEDTVYEVRAKHFKLVDSKWKDFGAGVLRLMKHKSDPKLKRIVKRNEIGKIQMNIAISPSMQFQKVVNAKKSFVQFIAVADRDAGPEKFMLQVKKENIEELHNQLQALAK